MCRNEPSGKRRGKINLSARVNYLKGENKGERVFATCLYCNFSPNNIELFVHLCVD